MSLYRIGTLVTVTLLPISHVHYGDFIACFSCPLRRLYCLFLISITATIAWFSSPLDLTIWTKSSFLGVKGGSNEFFTYLTVFRGVISFTYQKILLGDRVPLREWRRFLPETIFFHISEIAEKFAFQKNFKAPFSKLGVWAFGFCLVLYRFMIL